MAAPSDAAVKQSAGSATSDRDSSIENYIVNNFQAR
jgi:hypothetical protein